MGREGQSGYFAAEKSWENTYIENNDTTLALVLEKKFRQGGRRRLLSTADWSVSASTLWESNGNRLRMDSRNTTSKYHVSISVWSC